MKSARTKVLLTTTSFPSDRNPSAGTFIFNFSKALAQDLCVHVLAPSFKGARLRDLSSAGSEVSAFRYAPNSLEVLAQGAGGVPAALKKNKFIGLLIPGFYLGFLIAIFTRVRRVDCVQANWVFSGFAAVFPCVLFGKKLVLTLHGEDVRKLLSSTVHRFMFRCVASVSHRVVCVGEDMYQQLNKSFECYSSKIVFISNGVDESLFDSSVGVREPVEGLRVLIVASLISIKSVDHAIKALVGLTCDRDVTVSIIGDGPLASELKQLVTNLGVESKVVFKGVLSQAEVYREYFCHDVLLLCSQGEGRSSVIMEALATGLPVIGADVVGVTELLRNSPCAQLYPYGDIGALSDCLRLYAEQEELHILGEKNRAYADSLGIRWRDTASEYKVLLENN